MLLYVCALVKRAHFWPFSEIMFTGSYIVITGTCLNEPSHVPHKRLVPKRIAIETEKELPASEDRQKGKQTKKKRKCRVSICTVNCKHKVVRQIAMKLGMRDVGEDDSWNLYWADISLSLNKAKGLKRFQKINHFPGMSEICRKDLLARNLNRMLKIFPSDYNFFPKTWCLPADYGELVAYARTKRNQTYICKPTTGCQGRGIFVTKNVKEIKPHDKMVCQVYISRPFLVDGFKFDLRIFVLITSCDPLRIYVYNDGLVRFATNRYQEPTISNVSNVFMHLTNYSVNKHSPSYIMDEEVGSKRKISTLTKWLMKKQFNVCDLWSNVDDVILKTVVAAHPILKHNYHACFPAHDFTYACFELLGFDILLDYTLKPYVLEVNHSPSFHTDTQIDCDIKESLLKDTFLILNLTQADKKKVIEEDHRRVRERLLQGINCKMGPGNNGNSGSRHQDRWKTQVAWEESHLGNFRCIYPYFGCEKYDEFFHQNQSSLFQDTAASRARDECVRMQREELEAKESEAFHKLGQKNKNFDKLHLESSLVREQKPVLALRRRLVLPTKKYAAEKKQSFLNSFEPGHIIESEEQERCIRMAQRDFLLRRLGITEQIIHAMKKNGHLNVVDEKKFWLSKKEHVSYPEDENSRKLPSILPNSSKGKSQPSWVSGWSYINEPEVSTEQSEPGEKEGGTKTTGPEKGNYSRVRGGVKKFPCADIERRETNNLFHGSGRRKSKRLFRNHGLSKAKHNLSSERTYLHSVRI
ncbi:hypothetical protein Cfor_08246 [Coptotermes formosanus]|uniref:Uncharacterized protein n=1 Tax=Coptotermes formosanus TaxID=36987 RepID=A0A6L2PAJ7_COPFO|nr:hypothetical protein Cfor_08246 [Coptotermes formosanus]